MFAAVPSGARFRPELTPNLVVSDVVMAGFVVAVPDKELIMFAERK